MRVDATLGVDELRNVLDDIGTLVDGKVLKCETKDRFQMVVKIRVLLGWRNSRIFWYGDFCIFNATNCL